MGKNKNKNKKTDGGDAGAQGSSQGDGQSGSQGGAQGGGQGGRGGGQKGGQGGQGGGHGTDQKGGQGERGGGQKGGQGGQGGGQGTDQKGGQGGRGGGQKGGQGGQGGGQGGQGGGQGGQGGGQGGQGGGQGTDQKGGQGGRGGGQKGGQGGQGGGQGTDQKGGQKQQKEQWPEMGQKGGQKEQWPEMGEKGGQKQQKEQWPQMGQQGGAWGGKPVDQGQQQQQQQRPQQQRPQQQQQQQQQRPQQQQQQQQQRPQQQQQQQQRPQQQQQRQQQRPQQQQQQQWPQQQQQQQRPQQQQQQQQWPQQQQQQQWPQQQQQQQQQRPQQQQQQRPQQQQQQQQQQRPQQQQQQQQQRPQQQQKIGDHAQQSKQMGSTMSQTSISKIERGTLGRPDKVEVNYLRMNIKSMPDVAYHYDVTITPDRPKKFMRPVFEQFCTTFLPGIGVAFDGRRSFYTVQKLSVQNMEKEIQFNDKGRQISFRIQIQETGDVEVELSSLRNYFQTRVYDKPMRALQCLEVVLANPCHTRGVRAGRSFFTQPREKIDLDDGYELWTGLYQALILGDQPFLNVDISHKSFPSAMTVVEYIQRNCQRSIDLNRFPDARGLDNLGNFLKNLTVEYVPPKSFNALPKSYRVIKISDKPANNLTFQLENNQQMTVANYFQQKQYKLKYPNMPCLGVGSEIRTNYLPIELCNIPPGQALNRKDDSRQVQKMIRYAATTTNIRKDKIMFMLNHFNHNTDNLIRAFGIQIDRNFIEVPIRVLNSPMIMYNGNARVPVNNGSWNMSNSSRFLMTKETRDGFKWAIIYHDRSRVGYSTYDNLAQLLLQAASSRNLKLQQKPYIDVYQRIENKLIDLKKENYDIVIVIIPFAGVTYANIKKSAELTVGILTQCIKENTISRSLNPMLAQNIILKVNTKLSGLNHTFDDQQVRLNNVMFLGADVTHSSPDQRNIPSVVGVAASHDKYGGCYNMQYRLQPKNSEHIEDMESIFKQHLTVYHKYQNCYPEYVIYYRDGVSDGQFPIIRNIELRGIRSACEKMKIKIKLTCVIAVKRHHTRFFPMRQANPNDRSNKFNNVVPGTVCDSIIVHPNEIQFFMVSHQSIQGTAKPTRYNVIEDDANFKIDFLQALTNDLCHMFPRCNRVVSYPAPAYLAHLVAARGRVYLDGVRNFGELREAYRRLTIKPDFMQNNPSFFV